MSQLDEIDIKKIIGKIQMKGAPRSFEKMIKQYVDLANKPEYKGKPNMAAADVARLYKGVNTRTLISYINDLVSKGQLPRQLAAQVEETKMKRFSQYSKEVDEGIIGAVGRGIKKVASPITNRMTRAGRAAIAQKKIDRRDTKVKRRDTIAKARAAGKSAFGFTQKQRAANAQKKLDRIATKKKQLDTIARAKALKTRK